MVWLKIVPLLIAKVILKIVALFVYKLIDKKNNRFFGVKDATDLSYGNIAFRNSCHNFMARPQRKYTQTGNFPERKFFTDRGGNLKKQGSDPMEESGFKWRIRKSIASDGIKAGEYVSLRMTFLKARKGKKGKRELYFGWTLNEDGKFMRPTTQVRPAWIALLVIALLVWWAQ